MLLGYRFFFTSFISPDFHNTSVLIYSWEHGTSQKLKSFPNILEPIRWQSRRAVTSCQQVLRTACRSPRVPIHVSPTVWIFYLTPWHLSFHAFIQWFIDSFTATADTRYVPGNIPEEQIRGNGHCPSVCRTWRNVEQTREHLAVQRGGHKCQRLRGTRKNFIQTVRAVQAWNHCLCTGEADAREPWWVLGQPCWHGEFQTIQS